LVSVMRWSCAKSFATSQGLAPWTGAPCSRFCVHGLNKMGGPDFLYAAPDRAARAAFSKESRMRFANATKLHRKSGGALPFSFPASRCGPVVKALEEGRLQPMYAKTRTWGTRPRGKAWWQARKAEDEMTSNPRNRALAQWRDLRFLSPLTWVWLVGQEFFANVLEDG
jgi:hypothetical protein